MKSPARPQVRMDRIVSRSAQAMARASEYDVDGLLALAEHRDEPEPESLVVAVDDATAHVADEQNAVATQDSPAPRIAGTAQGVTGMVSTRMPGRARADTRHRSSLVMPARLQRRLVAHRLAVKDADGSDVIVNDLINQAVARHLPTNVEELAALLSAHVADLVENQPRRGQTHYVQQVRLNADLNVAVERLLLACEAERDWRIPKYWVFAAALCAELDDLATTPCPHERIDLGKG